MPATKKKNNSIPAKTSVWGVLTHGCQLDTLQREQREIGTFRENFVWSALGIDLGRIHLKDAVSLH